MHQTMNFDIRPLWIAVSIGGFSQKCRICRAYWVFLSL